MKLNAEIIYDSALFPRLKQHKADLPLHMVFMKTEFHAIVQIQTLLLCT